MEDWRGQLTKMVSELRNDGSIQSPKINEAFLNVPRHLFVPDADLDTVYAGGPIVTKFDSSKRPISSSSMPKLMAAMLENLDVRQDHGVLEIGTGTGYNAGLLRYVIGSRGQVVTVDCDQDLCTKAEDHLRLANIKNVKVVCGDGALGYPPMAPYDRITLTVGVSEMLPALVEQLGSDGLLQIPLWIRGLSLIPTFRQNLGHLVSVRSCGGGFMRLRGPFAGSEGYVPLANGWIVSADEPLQLDDTTLTSMLDRSTSTSNKLATDPEIESTSFQLFLAIQDPRFCVLSRNDDEGRFAALAFGLLDMDKETMTMIVRHFHKREQRIEILSTDGNELHEALGRYVNLWRSIQHKGLKYWRIRAFPEGEKNNHTSELEAGVMRQGRFDLSLTFSDAKEEISNKVG